MRHARPQPVRNKIDLADPSQIRSLKKRLGISADDLQRIAGKVGNSIAAVSKELQKEESGNHSGAGPNRTPAAIGSRNGRDSGLVCFGGHGEEATLRFPVWKLWLNPRLEKSYGRQWCVRPALGTLL